MLGDGMSGVVESPSRCLMADSWALERWEELQKSVIRHQTPEISRDHKEMLEGLG